MIWNESNENKVFKKKIKLSKDQFWGGFLNMTYFGGRSSTLKENWKKNLTFATIFQLH